MSMMPSARKDVSYFFPSICARASRARALRSSVAESAALTSMMNAGNGSTSGLRAMSKRPSPDSTFERTRNRFLSIARKPSVSPWKNPSAAASK